MDSTDLFLKWGDLSAFYYFILIIILLIIYIWSESFFTQKIETAFGKKVSSYLTQNLSIIKRRLKVGLQLLGMFFIIVAMARPQTGESTREIKSEGVELLILADVSESMMAEDVRPSRMSQMKIELSKLLDLIPGNKVGLIAFAGSSALLSPLTSDPGVLKMYIDSLDVNSVSSQGTNFETALRYAKEAFDRGGVTQDSQSRTTRVILVVSDGEDQEAGALDSAKALAKDGIKIYTIAYGTEKGGAIPTRDNYGNMTGFKKRSSGEMILTQVRGDFLKSLAEAGEGRFYFAFFNGDHLNQFVQAIGELEKSQFHSSVATQYEEKFTGPLCLGIFLILFSFFISDRKAKNSVLRGKYESEY